MRTATPRTANRQAPAATHERLVRETCERLGIEIRQVGAVFHLRSHCVDIKALDLRQVALSELLPPRS